MARTCLSDSVIKLGRWKKTLGKLSASLSSVFENSFIKPSVIFPRPALLGRSLSKQRHPALTHKPMSSAAQTLTVGVVGAGPPGLTEKEKTKLLPHTHIKYTHQYRVEEGE